MGSESVRLLWFATAAVLCQAAVTSVHAQAGGPSREVPLNLRGQWTDLCEKYTVAVDGENVTKPRYRTQVQHNNFGIGASWSNPVTLGVELGAKF